MVEILRNKNLATRFQILVEIARRGPNIQQRDIAARLGVTPQAISDYIKQLVKEGLLIAEGRSQYRPTNEGVNWTIKILRELRSYDAVVQQAITSISVSAAIAAADLKKGQTVGLEMREGLLYATPRPGKGACGIAATAARAGEDIGVSHIEGIVDFNLGKVTVLKVPSVKRGGTGRVDLARLKKEVAGKDLVGVVGIEAVVALKKVSPKHAYLYGASDAAIEAVRSGLSPAIACVDDAVPGFISRLEEANIAYEVIDLLRS